MLSDSHACGALAWLMLGIEASISVRVSARLSVRVGALALRVLCVEVQISASVIVGAPVLGLVLGVPCVERSGGAEYGRGGA